MPRLTVVASPSYEVDIGPHVFPTQKYRRVRDLLEADGTAVLVDWISPEPVDDEALGRVHTAEYLTKIREDTLTAGERAVLEVPFSRDLADVMRLCCGGSVITARRAMDEGVALHLGGGFHHAFPGHGEGFCLLNDVAVAAAQALAEGLATRVAVVDLDVHQGNGTAAIFADEPRVFTLSVHQEGNYPAWKPPSDLDVGLPDGMGDDDYLARLEKALEEVCESSPELVIYLAGADPYREDQLGGLGLTEVGLRRRDRTVLRWARSHAVPVAIVLAGGYAVDPRDTVRIHAATVEEALAATEG